jgi:glucuronoarabinoxylan endo-1,4-beta-xylanase
MLVFAVPYCSSESGNNNSQPATSSPAAAGGTVTVDYGTKHQIIRGFGAASAWLTITPARATALFNQNQGLGLSILRVHIDPKGSTLDNWVTRNWAQERKNALLAKAANQNTIVFASPYSPPVSMKTSSASQPYYSGNPPCSPESGYCGGYLKPSSYKDYAQFIESFVKFMSAGGVNLYGVSMANEPDWSARPKEHYESCSWTPDQMHTWIANYGSVLTTRLIMPESYFFDKSLSQPSLDDPKTRNLIGIIGEHLYGVKNPPYYSQAVEAGKDVWMTEHYIKREGKPQQQFITDGLAAAEEIHNSMVGGQYNAYVWWWALDWAYGNPKTTVNFGLLDPDDNPTFYGYALGQYSKFIQPGYYRYDATPNPSKNMYVSAYSGSEEGKTHYVIVAINAGTTPVRQSFTINNAAFNTMTPWQTTDQSGLGKLPAVAVSNGTFSYVLPAQSITTFVQ